mmetsp:Transcript_5108/g.15106  ORF Transcript_5108/g.15106 Transcript_5108/m.15106 type:complete len:330 (+) Transcript_5108:894-1883(+)
MLHQVGVHRLPAARGGAQGLGEGALRLLGLGIELAHVGEGLCVVVLLHGGRCLEVLLELRLLGDARTLVGLHELLHFRLELGALLGVQLAELLHDAHLGRELPGGLLHLAPKVVQRSHVQRREARCPIGELALRLARLLLLLLYEANLLKFLLERAIRLRLLHLRLVHEAVVEEAQVAQVREDVRPVVVLTGHGVPRKGDRLELVELAEHLGLLEISDAVVAHGEHLEGVHLRVEPLDGLDVVVEERQVLELGQLVQARDVLDVVEGEIQPLEVDEVVQIFDLDDHIVVQVELHQLLEALEVVDFQDILKGEHEALHLPEFDVVLFRGR